MRERKIELYGMKTKFTSEDSKMIRIVLMIGGRGQRADGHQFTFDRLLQKLQ